jgi:hypothetical protein
VYSVCLDLLLRKKKRNLERRTWNYLSLLRILEGANDRRALLGEWFKVACSRTESKESGYRKMQMNEDIILRQ